VWNEKGGGGRPFLWAAPIHIDAAGALQLEQRALRGPLRGRLGRSALRHCGCTLCIGLLFHFFGPFLFFPAGATVSISAHSVLRLVDEMTQMPARNR
jgi:hypothetical protein